MRVNLGGASIEVFVHLSERAFIAELESQCHLVLDRFERLYRAGLLPVAVTELSISYDLDVPTGILRISSEDQVILAIETPDELLSNQPIQFNATWSGDCWYMTAWDE